MPPFKHFPHTTDSKFNNTSACPKPCFMFHAFHLHPPALLCLNSPHEFLRPFGSCVLTVASATLRDVERQAAKLSEEGPGVV